MGKRLSPYVQPFDESCHFKLRPGGKPLLTTLDLELTERCNHQCIHCYINVPASEPEIEGKELTTKEIKEILTEAVILGCSIVRFTGGEPLLRNDFEEIYIHARSLGLPVMLFTNGTLISPPIARLLARVPPMQKVEITLYGMSADSYEAITMTPGSYMKAMEGIRLLLDHEVPFVLKFPVLPQNLDDQ